MGKPKKTACYDGQYAIDLMFSDEIDPESGKYVSAGDTETAIIIVNPMQPRFDQMVALTHEIDHHIAWARGKKTFTSHRALDYHAERFVALLQNSPKLAEHYYLFATKKGA